MTTFAQHRTAFESFLDRVQAAQAKTPSPVASPRTWC